MAIAVDILRRRCGRRPTGSEPCGTGIRPRSQRHGRQPLRLRNTNDGQGVAARSRRRNDRHRRARSVVFLPSSTTVSAVDQAVGDTVGDGDTVLTLAAPTQEVLVDVPAGDEAQVVPGLAVDLGSVQGTVTRLRSADRDGSVVVEAVITPASAIENATNGSAVTVTLTLQNDFRGFDRPGGSAGVAIGRQLRGAGPGLRRHNEMGDRRAARRQRCQRGDPRR